MDPKLLRKAPEILLDEIAWHASELVELLNKVEKVPDDQKDFANGIFTAATTEMKRRGIIVGFEAGDDSNQAEV